MPVFNGEDAESWVLWVEQYFEMGDFTETEKLQAVRICLAGEALMWYRWEKDRNPFLNWDMLKRRLLEQFSENLDTSAGERLLMLCQEGTVKDFCRDFIALATNAPELQEETLELAFMIGHRAQIRARMKTFEPRGLKKMMSVAKQVDEWGEEPEMTTGKFSGGYSRGATAGQRNNSSPISQSRPAHGSAGNKPNNHNYSGKTTSSFRGGEQKTLTRIIVLSLHFTV